MEKNYKTNQGKVIEVKIAYDIGGMNYFTGSVEKRGYYLHATPMDVVKSGDYVTKTMTAFSGYKILVLEVKRKSKKQEEKAIQLAKEWEEKILNDVCQKNNLTLENQKH